MRVGAGKIKRVYPGDEVRIHVRLPSGVDYARYSVWSSSDPNEEFSPHIQLSRIGAVNKGRPLMHQPMHGSLSREIKTRRTVSFTAEEALFIRVMQEKDTPSDATLRVTITRRGVLFQRIIKTVRNFLSSVTSKTEQGAHNA